MMCVLEGAAGSSAAPTQVLAWEDDPGAPDAPNQPVERPLPDIGVAPLPTKIAGAVPAAERAREGTAEFRYWVAADALRRAADFWGGVCGELPWHDTVGQTLPIKLDEGEELNAYYDREALNFFHGKACGTRSLCQRVPTAS
jgi:hypothetical protein